MALIPQVDNSLAMIYVIITLCLMSSYYLMHNDDDSTKFFYSSVMSSWCVASIGVALFIQKNIMGFSPMENIMAYCLCLMVTSSTIACVWSM